MRDQADPADLEVPFRHHPLGECTVCGAETFPDKRHRLCEDCRKELQRREREMWWGKDGPAKIFVGLATARKSLGIVLEGQNSVEGEFPLVRQVHRPEQIAFGWDPQSEQFVVDENPPEDICWLFWKDKDDGLVKSKVFWGMWKGLDYMDELYKQGHEVHKAGIKRFPVRRG